MKIFFPFAGRLLLLCTALFLLDAAPAQAQRHGGERLGVGVELGSPSGITLKFEGRRRYDLEFLAAWDLDNFLFINGHALFHRNLQGEPDLYFFYGPGIFIGARDRGRGRDDDLILGISGRFGLAYGFEPFEVYIQLTPRLDLIPGTDGDLGGGIGFRFFL